jgi:hypothetical protein
MLMPALAALTLVAGCAANEAMLESEQPSAVTAATERAQTNLGCAAPKATVLSSTIVPTVGGFRTMAPPRQQYVIGIEGCSQPATYVVVCDSEYGRCFATDAPD